MKIRQLSRRLVLDYRIPDRVDNVDLECPEAIRGQWFAFKNNEGAADMWRVR